MRTIYFLKRRIKAFIFMSFISIIFFHSYSCTGTLPYKYLTNEIDVILFSPGEYGNKQDIETYQMLAGELGLTSKEVNYAFLNQKEAFFYKDGRRKFKVLILPGGEQHRWFQQTVGQGLNCYGVRNILEFIESGGSVIAICVCGSSLFVNYYERFGATLEEAQRGEWYRTQQMRRVQGYFKRFCGVNPPFEGIVRGPQETNRPYPKTRFLPIRMNPENEIVRQAKLPSTIYQIVTGGGSLIPFEGQPLDAVGWYPNGTVAIGVVPYGKGKIILSNPHPNITGERAWKWFPNGVLGPHAKRFGWTDEMIADGLKLIRTEGDPDGPGPDWALAKAMLSYAFKEGSK